MDEVEQVVENLLCISADDVHDDDDDVHDVHDVHDDDDFR